MLYRLNVLLIELFAKMSKITNLYTRYPDIPRIATITIGIIQAYAIIMIGKKSISLLSVRKVLV
ncbi:MAG: hypothetical protein HOM82_04155 [Thaumarchaeota archaeon]|nr:hypothetical protein [Nitrososphaerota archaeon]